MIGGQMKGTLPMGCRMSLPLIRMARRSDDPTPGQVPTDSGVHMFDWAGHPLRITIRPTP
jgi:hypothetical protein